MNHQNNSTTVNHQINEEERMGMIFGGVLLRRSGIFTLLVLTRRKCTGGISPPIPHRKKHDADGGGCSVSSLSAARTSKRYNQCAMISRQIALYGNADLLIW